MVVGVVGCQAECHVELNKVLTYKHIGMLGQPVAHLDKPGITLLCAQSPVQLSI